MPRITAPSGAISAPPATADQGIKHELRPLLKEWGAVPEWFEPLRLSWEKEPVQGDAVVRVAFPHRYFAAWFGAQGRQLLEQALTRRWPGTAVVYDMPLPPAAAAPAPPSHEKEESLFSTFLQGNKNQITVRLLRDAALGSGIFPVILRGPAGSGKSHLLKACFQLLRARFPEACFLSCADLEEYLNPASEGRHFLRSRPALLLDDLQLLENRPALQHELASLLDDFLPRPFFCACPERKPKLAPELATRLEAGTLLLLPEADLDMRMRYVQNLLSQRGLHLPREQQLLLARRCLNMRQIQGVTGHLATLKDYHGRVPDSGELDALLRQTGSGRSLNADQILAVVAAHYNCPVKDLRGSRRDSRLVLARQMAMFLCRKLLKETYPGLGRFFGGKDHSTIIYGVKKIELSQVRNKDMHNEVTLLTQKCLQLLE